MIYEWCRYALIDYKQILLLYGYDPLIDMYYQSGSKLNYTVFTGLCFII